MSAESSKDGTGRLDVGALLEGKELLVVGGTGFLGKTWLSMLLTHYPQIGHVWLMVRPRKDQDSEARFWADVATAWQLHITWQKSVALRMSRLLKKDT